VGIFLINCNVINCNVNFSSLMVHMAVIAKIINNLKIAKSLEILCNVTI